jgi:hypothetical protein
VETYLHSHGAIPNIRANIPPMRGDVPLAVAAPPVKEVGPIFDHENLSNNGWSSAQSSTAARSHPLLSQVGSSRGNASFGHNLPCDKLCHYLYLPTVDWREFWGSSLLIQTNASIKTLSLLTSIVQGNQFMSSHAQILRSSFDPTFSVLKTSPPSVTSPI